MVIRNEIDSILKFLRKSITKIIILIADFYLRHLERNKKKVELHDMKMTNGRGFLDEIRNDF